jgi:hypothetical protein
MCPKKTCTVKHKEIKSIEIGVFAFDPAREILQPAILVFVILKVLNLRRLFSVWI